MLKATDAALCELARRAGVRPAHIFHFAHYRKAIGDGYSAEGYAAFARMELRFVEAMEAVLATLPKVERKPRQAASRTVLAADWVMPEDWVAIGREKRFWPLDVCRTEADKFVNWHRMKGNAFADWKAAWRNWIDGSRREDGRASAEPELEWTPERKAAHLAKWANH